MCIPDSNCLTCRDVQKPFNQTHGRSLDFFSGGTLRKFLKNLLRKLRKRIILAYFSKNLTTHALHFCAFGRKTQIVGKF